MSRKLNEEDMAIFLSDGTRICWDEDLMDENIVPLGSTIFLKPTAESEILDDPKLVQNVTPNKAEGYGGINIIISN